MHDFLVSVVELPAPINAAILAAVTLVLGLFITQLTKVPRLGPWLANLLGQYVDEVAIAVAGAIVVYVNNLLAQIPAGWEGVAFVALQFVIAILAALGLITQIRKARVALQLRGSQG
jgi:prepilin signal peptidase PulO-like enzyme (type II secretory pathway)